MPALSRNRRSHQTFGVTSRNTSRGVRLQHQPVVDSGRSPDETVRATALRALRPKGVRMRGGRTDSHATIGRNGSEMRFGLTRLASAVLAVTLTVNLALFAPAANANAGDSNSHAADFLLSQLVENERIETTFGEMSFPDAGLTADVLFALYAANVPEAQTAPALNWFASQVDSYTGAPENTFAGAVAKTLLVAAASENTDLFDVSALRDRLVNQITPSGRFVDTSSFGDFSNTITQSLAILALHRVAPDLLDATAVSYLASQACPDGGFPSSLEPDTCTSNVDATGFAVQALHATGETAAVTQALAWLTQELDAGRIDNANAAGLAASSFALTGALVARDQARDIIDGLQNGCVANVPQAIRFTASDAGDLTRATAQALFGRLGGNLATVTAPASGVLPVALDCPPRFSDLDYDTSLHASNIVALQQLGALGGFGDGTFRPRATVTRGQFATLLVAATGTPTVTDETPFTDLTGDTHATALTTLYVNGVITGFADNTVRGSARITRGQAAAMLQRFLEREATGPAPFNDVADSPFADAIAAMSEASVFQGVNGEFRPSALLRRDQTASVINQVVNLP